MINIRTIPLALSILASLVGGALGQDFCIDFENVDAGTQFRLGDPAFKEDDIEMQIGSPEGDDVTAEVTTGGNAGHSGHDLWLNAGSLEFTELSTDRLTFHYSHGSLGAFIRINSAAMFNSDFFNFDGVSLGGVLISVETSAQSASGSTGIVTLIGEISDVAVGGEIYIDHLVSGNSCESEPTTGLGVLTIVDTDLISPAEREVRLRLFTTVDIESLVLFRSTDLNSGWEEVDEPVFTQQPGAAQIWNISTIVARELPDCFFRIGRSL